MIHIPFGHANSLACENSITVMGMFLLPSSAHCWLSVNNEVNMVPEEKTSLIFTLNKLNKISSWVFLWWLLPRRSTCSPRLFFKSSCSQQALWTSYSNFLFFSVKAITPQMMLWGRYPQQNEGVSSPTETQKTAWPSALGMGEKVCSQEKAAGPTPLRSPGLSHQGPSLLSFSLASYHARN